MAHTYRTPLTARTAYYLYTLHTSTTPPDANAGGAPLSLFNDGCARLHDARP
ncbi:hypothetical protein CCUS01_12846 [Colletotrichum cuscutae]|uniref:Uncharacterized protein n=1 Tax=Colletotrichum cuscutae TaxID=1209917 RepID=A0AAJ0DQE8_9PEZI|nr:hypothetical protein CCUS01_12846 [Colletotrichum cuscutae]